MPSSRQRGTNRSQQETCGTGGGRMAMGPKGACKAPNTHDRAGKGGAGPSGHAAPCTSVGVQTQDKAWQERAHRVLETKKAWSSRQPQMGTRVPAAEGGSSKEAPRRPKESSAGRHKTPHTSSGSSPNRTLNGDEGGAQQKASQAHGHGGQRLAAREVGAPEVPAHSWGWGGTKGARTRARPAPATQANRQQTRTAPRALHQAAGKPQLARGVFVVVRCAECGELGGAPRLRG